MAEVAFGTSGVRGRVEDLTHEVCTAYTRAFLEEVAADAGRVAIGIDRRPSSPGIARHCADAVQATGRAVVWCGVLPTPALALAQERGVALSRLLEALPDRHTASDRIKETPTEWSRALLAELVADRGWIEDFEE